METQIKSVLTVLVLIALSAKAMSSIVPTQERVVPHQFSCTNPSIHSKVPTVSLYYALVDAADWDEASVKCNETYSGSRLASIETLAELNCLAQNLDPFAPVTYWTAGRFVDSMGWIWDVDHIPYPFPQDTTWLWTADQPAFETALSRANFHVTNTWDAKLSSVVKSEEYLPLCELSEPIPVPCRNPNDLVLVVDSSGSIGADNFNLALTFVARLSNAFTPHVDTRFSYVVYSTGAETPIKLNNSLTPEQIDSLVLNTVYRGGGTDTALGITIATTELVINPRNAPQTFVVLTDGQSNDPAATIAAAQQAVNRGIRTYAVGIGAGVNAAELLAIAGGIPENVYSLETFDQLINVLVPISLKVCPMS